MTMLSFDFIAMSFVIYSQLYLSDKALINTYKK